METIPAVTRTAMRSALATDASQSPKAAQTETGSTAAGTGNVAATQENMERVQMAVKTLDLFMQNQPETRFHFQVHADSGKIQVQLVNFRTGEVVEEVPSNKLLDFTAQLEELTGLVLEKHA